MTPLIHWYDTLYNTVTLWLLFNFWSLWTLFSAILVTVIAGHIMKGKKR